MNTIQTLGLVGILGITGCTTTVREKQLNHLSKRNMQQLTAAHQYATQPRTTEAQTFPSYTLSLEQMMMYTDFPRVTCTVHGIPAGDSTTNSYWEGRIDTTAPIINQSIPVLEKLAESLPRSEKISRLTFPDHAALIGTQSGLRAVELYHTGTNDALAITIQRVTGITHGKDNAHYTFAITTGVPRTHIKSTDRNYLAFINTAEATGIGMAILPFEGGIFGAGQAIREGMFYWNTRNPTVTKTRVHTISDLDERNGRVRTIAETAHTLNANHIYVHDTPAGMLVVYGQDTKRALAGPNAEAGVPPATFSAERVTEAHSHLGALFWRAVEVGAGAGLMRAFPLERTLIRPVPGAPAGVSGGSIGGPGGI